MGAKNATLGFFAPFLLLDNYKKQITNQVVSPFYGDMYNKDLQTSQVY
jgi:hypothetical protein